jgi:serine/threonine protein kinase
MVLRVGNIVAGRYELVEEIGRGGFGCVYRARQLEIGREVAIKVIYPPTSPGELEQLRARFRREALMLSSLNHPNTIRQYDFGDNENGLMYFVMEYLKGRTLEDILEKDGPMSESRVAHIARGVLKSLSEAHAQNIVHRDLKPGNIMLCEVHGEKDFVKVLDFGIAKTTQGQHDITSAGMTLGSPGYMAPELLRGDQPVAASDLYALALTLVECLTAVPLVKGDNMLQCARIQLSPTPLEVPAEVKQSALWPWLSRALEKDVNRRFPSSEAMLAALEDIDRTRALRTTADLGDDPRTQRLDAIRSPDASTLPPQGTFAAATDASTQPLPTVAASPESPTAPQPSIGSRQDLFAGRADGFDDGATTMLDRDALLSGVMPSLDPSLLNGPTSSGFSHGLPESSKVAPGQLTPPSSPLIGLGSALPAHAVNSAPLATAELNAPKIPPKPASQPGPRREAPMDQDTEKRLMTTAGIIVAVLFFLFLLLKLVL